LKEIASRLTEEDCHVVAICKLEDNLLLTN